MIPDPQILSAHQQLYPASCVPMSVELVVKLLGTLPVDQYPLQQALGPWLPSSFSKHDGVTHYGIAFKREFALNRDDKFPIDALFARILEELTSGRYVIVSLASPGGWHMYVVHTYNASTDEFEAVSKQHPNGTINISDVKHRIRQMKGTDILTYTI